MDSQEEELKQNLINEQVIEKGYNPEDLSNYISRTKSVQIDKITFEELQKIIDNFKNERLKIPSAIYISKKKSIKNTNDDILYQNYRRIINCYKPTETPLSSYKSLDIVVTVADKGDNQDKSILNFSKNWQYMITTKELHFKTIRLYQDFEWLRQQLSEEYSTIIVPPLPETPVFAKLDASFFNMKIRYLNKFMAALVAKKTFRTSELLYIFLTMTLEDFNTYKVGLVNKKIVPKLQNKTGSMELTVSKDLINEIRSFNKYVEPCTILYKKLNQSMQTLLNDYSVLGNHLKEISDIYFQITEQARLSQQGERIQKVLKTMGNLFKCYSNAYTKQKDVINSEYKEMFDYMNLELMQMIPLIKDFKEKKHTYKTFELKLKNKKESYFNEKPYNKWEIIPKKDEVIDYLALEKDKEMAFKLMFTKETKESLSYKEQMALTIKTLLENYKKLVKNQDERIKLHFEGLQNRNKELVADAQNIIGFLNFKL